MFSIHNRPFPRGSLLAAYLADKSYVDAYWTEVEGRVSLPEFVYAFYTTWIFQVERWILTWTVDKPSTDEQAQQIAYGNIEAFAAWNLEARNETELLMCDFTGRTRSWFMATPTNTDGGARTRLYFGSAVVPVRDPRTGELSLGIGYRTLLMFHKLYSFLLLYFAKLALQSKLSETAIQKEIRDDE